MLPAKTSSLLAAGDVLRETSPAAKSEEKRMFSRRPSLHHFQLLFRYYLQ